MEPINTLSIPVIRTKANCTTYSSRFQPLYTLEEAEYIITQRKRLARIRLKRKLKRKLQYLWNTISRPSPSQWGIGLLFLSIIMQQTTGEVNQYLFTIPTAIATLFIKA